MVKLLLVDPNPAAVLRMLETPDMVVLPMRAPPQALELAKDITPDALLCDLTTPGLEAKAFIENLRRAAPAVKVLLTGSGACKLMAKRLVEQGLASRFLAKPWPATMIRNAVRSLVDSGVKVIAQGDERTESALQARMREAQDDTVLFSGSRFRLDGLLGEGGTGRVYLARDLLLDTPVALKLLHPRLSRDADSLNALAEEARILIDLSNPHIVRCFNLERREDVYFLVMEYIGGGSLLQAMADPAFRGTGNTLATAAAIATALDCAHSRGVLHCDLTAGNVLFTADGVPKLIDFGIAQLANRARRNDEYIMGTPAFMSPEQLRGEALDARTDVFSFGVLLCQMLTGYLPQGEDWTMEDLAWQPRPEIPGLAPAVAAVLQRALSVDRAARFGSAGELYTALAAAFTQSGGG